MAQARKTLQRAPLRTLAVLLLMNGQSISVKEIAAVLKVKRIAVYIHLATLKEHGVWQIVTSHGKHRLHQRHRLAGLPPDELLGPLLLEVDELKRSAWWAELTSTRRQRTA